ncbi:MAG: hypothetical protein IJZ83_07165 [Clostridia bacterium]|nr:hypothetical protein [Clostridia bacterium]
MKYKIKDYPELWQKVSGMNIDELLTAVICPNYILEKQTPARNTTCAFIHPTTKEMACKEVPAINEGRCERALIATDLEYGTAKMIKGTVGFPSMRAVAETADESLAYKMGVLTANEATSSGYHWTFSPCVDILGNRRNPIVSIRTAGEDADTVLRFGGAYMRGLQDGGLIATLKHFPGDGYSFDDQHVTTTENPLSYEEWEKSFGRVYRELIEYGAKAIMPGHISFPSYDDIDSETGLYPPATVSKKLLTGLLRRSLGFEGIIVSDATNMTGFCGYVNLYRAMARFLEAGGDCLLFVHATEEYISEMKKQIAEGVLKTDTLRNRAYRMLCFSREYFEDAEHRKISEYCESDVRELAKKVTQNSVKLVRDRNDVLPFRISSQTKIAHIILANNGVTETTCVAAYDLSERLRKKGAMVTDFADPGPSAALKLAKSGEYDLIICSVSNEMSYGLNTVKLSGKVARNMMNGWMKYSTPTVFISYYDPYFGDDFEAPVDTLINTYGYCEYTNSVIIEKIIKERSE